MMETKPVPYDVAEFLETTEEMAAYLDAYIQESEGMLSSLQKHLEILLVPGGCLRSHASQSCHGKACIKQPLMIGAQVLTQS